MESLSIISLLFCLSKLVRTGSVWPVFVDELSACIDHATDRIPFIAPPAEATEKSRKLFDLLYDLNSAHYNRGGGKSLLHKDVEYLLSVDNGLMANRHRFVQYCHHPGKGVCCDSAADTKNKLKEAYSNLFLCHSFPTGTLSRWTHIKTLLCILLSSHICRNVLFKAALAKDPATTADQEPTLSAGSAGAGDADQQLTHNIRKRKVLDFLGRQQTPRELVALYFATSATDRLVYFFMGGGPDHQSRKPGTVPKSDQPILVRELLQEVNRCRSSLCETLRGVGDDGSMVHLLLDGVGCSEQERDSKESLLFFRRLCLQLSAGIFRRLELRLNSFPYKCWVLGDKAASDMDKRAAIDDFLAAPDCCLGWFGRRLRAVFGTQEALSSVFCQVVIMTWMRTLIFSIYSCERPRLSAQTLDRPRPCEELLACGSGEGARRHPSHPHRTRLRRPSRSRGPRSEGGRAT